MTNGLQVATSGLSPALASAPMPSTSARRSDKSSSAPGNPSFSQVLQQQQQQHHQAAAPAAIPAPKAPALPPPSVNAPTVARAPDAQPAPQPHRSMDQSASKLAERQATARSADARQMEVNQQANRDADAQAQKAADSRRDARDASAGKSGNSEESSAPKQHSEAKAAGKATGNSHHHHLAAHPEKGKAVHAKKGEPGEADAKTTKAKGTAATAAAATDAAATGAVPLTPQGTPVAQTAEGTDAAAKGAAPDAASGVKGAADAAHPKLTTETLTAETAGGVPGQEPALGMKHALAGGHARIGGEGTAGTKLIQSAKEDAAKTDALAADARADALTGSMPGVQGASFANAMHALGADQQQNGAQGDASRRQSESPARIEGAGGAASAGMAGAAAAGPTQHAAEAPAPSQLIFGTPITAPDFAQVLGVSITNLASEGVQQARLHMNPVETGPIQIQITLDGTQAQVDFQAANAQTRDAITAGMPELAAALNAAGLTLTGGGVSEQSRGRGDDGQGDQRPASFGQRAGAGSDAPATRTTQVITRTPRGAVDLYA